MDYSDLETLFFMQSELQEKIFGTKPEEMSDEEAVLYISRMVLEATDELHEILGEIKGWKGHHLSQPVRINREQAGREARDALQYVINILLACGWGASRLMEEYQTKIGVNFARLEGIGGEKCPQCYRGLDDPGAVSNCPEIDCLQKDLRQ